MQVKLEQERLQREQSEKANKTLEHKLQQKEMKLQLLGAEKEKLTTRHKKLLLKINQLETLIKNAVFSTYTSSFSTILTPHIQNAYFMNKFN